MKIRYFIIFLVLILFIPSCGQVFKKGFPQYSGKIASNGLKEPVEIYRDGYGIPHIYAKNDHDLYFAQGYVHAQDRLWQMETTRRFAKGRLSEITGKDTIELDMTAHLWEIDKMGKSVIQRMDENMMIFVKAYVDGINAYIKEMGKNLPLEFSSLKLVPEPYTVEDVFSLLTINAIFLSNNLQEEILAIKMMNRFSTENLAELIPSCSDIKLGTDEYFNSFRNLKVSPFLKAVYSRMLNDSSQASNCWVANGRRTVNGNAILANDPHLRHGVPGVWYITHYNSPSMNVIGASMPGSPGIVIGHNESVAWGITNVRADYVDLYVVKVDPEHPTRYFVDGKSQEMEKEEITINVKGGKPEQRTIYHTIYGPIITTMEKGYDVQVALKWYNNVADKTFEAYFKINRAKSVKDIFEAGEYFGIVCMNLMCADSQGNIGWHVTGNIPIRKGYSGRLPADGSQSNFRWNGFIPYEQLPFAFNPPEGSIVTANQRTTTDEYPYDITHSWIAPYRANRIEQLLSSKSKLSTDDNKEIQDDVYSLQAEKLISQMSDLSPKDNKAKFALESLRNWDKNLTKDSWQASVYEMFIIALERNVFADEIGNDFRYYVDVSGLLAVDNVFSKPDSSFWDMANTPEQETREQILEKSLSDAVSFLTDRFRKDSKNWKWGKLHQIKFNHPGATNWFTKRYMNAGSYPFGGDSNTINTAWFKSMNLETTIIPSLRMVVDVGKKSVGQIVIPMGQSGQPQHPHYEDMIKLWLDKKYVPMYLKKEDVLANKKELLILNPINTSK